MIKKLENLATSLPLVGWIALCEAIVIAILVIWDCKAEAEAWTLLANRGMLIWQIIGVIAITWLRNGIFWSWFWIVGFGALLIRSSGLKKAKLTNRNL
jgi:hypothetical protein